MNQDGHSEPQTVPRDQKPVFNVWQGLALVAHITGYILGPLVFLGALGFWLDRVFNGHKIIFILSCLFAFVCSNYLVFKKAMDISKRYR